MENKRHFSANRLFNLFVIVGLLLLLCSVYIVKTENETAFGIFFGVLGLFFLIGTILLMPYCHIFDDEGVSSHFLFYPPERYLWKNIHEIIATDDSTRHRSLIGDFLFCRIFEIRGKVEGEQRFYMFGHIRRTRRTKRFLEKYWDGTITGYLSDDVRAWLRRRKDKKEHTIKVHLTDEIVPMERQVRSEVRAVIKPIADRAAQYGLKIKDRYVYVTSGGNEHRSRPNENYTYEVVVNIVSADETDNDIKAELFAILLHVRLGKTAYRGVKNYDDLKGLGDAITDELDAVIKSGMSLYLNETL